MELHSRALPELDPLTLYQLLRLRVDVFVVEQRCAYRELDGRDIEPDARHCYITADDEVVACLRVLADPGGVTRVGRVATAAAARGRGLSTRLLTHALNTSSRPLVLDAQAHLVGYYARHGFLAEGEEFLEDGIPHRRMRLT